MGPHDPCHVSNYFIERGKKDDRPFTPMQIQKLIFFAHGWMLAIHDRELLNREFEAWQYGPVMPVVYYNLSYYGGNLVDKPLLAHPQPFDEKEDDVLDQVYDLYGEFDGIRLSNMTHVREGPWHKTWQKHKRQVVIPNKMIRQYFRDIREQASKYANG